MSEQKSSALSLRDIVEGKNFRVPLYQRNYKWNKEQAEKLVADLIDACNNKVTKSIGLITLYKNEDKYDVIDGQQRLITLSILLNILNSNYSIALTFQRDDNNKIRENALKGSMDYTTDTDRISRNREAIKNGG